jgi:hypothetical protein
VHVNINELVGRIALQITLRKEECNYVTSNTGLVSKSNTRVKPYYQARNISSSVDRMQLPLGKVK